ncbi:patatin-domain-containing protein [Dothidotthia symphoricarpi CBS 119687]|uniref:Patatin-like phospholipase domain-containing protein n=1 Tax=Dothidotthia symphoricarpi CBS 119687 TaxID=1392245 RepID=A0A6A6AKE0_9PLEO|nr:patatin-domain-containing protein [Dothidotthia symphoricarpi CBS 119687]KAF2132419.1 patatin-domain-containing protein [Dothidotthia symphoricarpi CBS 119687]
MSFLFDNVLARGSTGLHIAGGGNNAQRKSRSHGGFLTPLVQLVRDPVGALSSAVDSHYSAPIGDALGEDADRRQVLYLRMKNAESYDEWRAAATDLDALEGNDVWKEEDNSEEYHAALVAARLSELDDARLNCDVTRMMFLIRTALTRGLGDMGDLRLYKHSHIGTKKLIERYIDSAQSTMAALLDVSEKQGNQCPIDPSIMVEQLLNARQSFGRSALLLSGGGTFGMNHIGVVKSLWDASLLPRIISGASAGSIVSAVLCTRTDEEIPDFLLDFCYGDLAVFEKVGEPESIMQKVVRLFKTGSFFDISHLARVMRDLLGDTTFQEAYNRTRRILNIPVSTSSLYELPRLLNYVTAPNVMIWSAVCTSCSVPVVYKKASLLAKDPKTGKEVPWDANPDAAWIDGSVDNDLPMTRLAEMFNVNHFIVSQVNPHVVPFLAKEEEIIATEAQQNPAFFARSSWVSTAVSLGRGELLHRLQVVADAGIFPNYVTKIKSILSQRYSGDINIFPAIAYADFPKVLTNPTSDYMLGCLLTGQRATWPKLSRVRNHVAIELALDDLIQKMRARVVFRPSQVDLGRNNLSRAISQGNLRSREEQATSEEKTARFEHKTAPSSPLLQKSGFASPFLSRSSLKTHDQPIFPPRRNPAFKRAKTRSTYDPVTDKSEDSSDRDYFAEVDSDTSAILSSPSPPTSPSVNGPTLWPSSSRHMFFSPISPPCVPSTATASDRRNGTLLNLAMTSAAPSSPEQRYKRLFHPPEPVASDVFSAKESEQHGEDGVPATPLLDSTPRSRRGSVHGSGLGLILDPSGTRGMLLRKKSFKNFLEL